MEHFILKRKDETKRPTARKKNCKTFLAIRERKNNEIVLFVIIAFEYLFLFSFKLIFVSKFIYFPEIVSYLLLDCLLKITKYLKLNESGLKGLTMPSFPLKINRCSTNLSYPCMTLENS